LIGDDADRSAVHSRESNDDVLRKIRLKVKIEIGKMFLFVTGSFASRF
jgi:hypothetical protein